MRQIREATLDDIERIMPLVEELNRFAKNDELGLKYDLESAQIFATTFIERQNATIFIAEDNGAIVGAMALVLLPWDLNHNQKIVLEQAWYIDPTERGKGLNKWMLDLAEYWGHLKGATTLIMCSIETNQRSLKNLYNKNGFKRVSTSYLKEI